MLALLLPGLFMGVASLAHAAAPAQDGSVATLPPQASPRPSPGTSFDALMRAGDQAMLRGDVSRARAIYQRAVALDPQSAAACLSLGSTYDPNMLATIEARGGGLVDAAKAREWYERARALGHPAADRVLSRLP
ncbi:MAG: hypothetical protein DI601_09455 [Azospirillum brasilense]|nr:MAG: hypothetical protein DI601_09455 [Azospirillum brasilense]